MMRLDQRLAALGVLATCAGSPALADQYLLEIESTGAREYYCTMTVSLTNRSDAPLTEINGFFLLFIDGAQVGRSKGTSFSDVAPGETIKAVFETPNAPCAEAEERRFVVGACRIGMGFEDKAVCAAALAGAETIVIEGGAG